jgi:hypothetical protein
VTGSTANDTLTIASTSLDLTSTTLTSVEILAAGNSSATTFTVDQADLLSGGSVTGSTGNDTLTFIGTSLDLTNTTLTSIENILGTGAGDSITGSAGADTITGAGGVDTIDGAGGNDRIVWDAAASDQIDAGANTDTLALTGVTGATTVDLSVPAADQVTTLNGAADATVQQNFENLDASAESGAFTVTAAAAGSMIATGSGIDGITGGAGADTIQGGGSGDTIALGAADGAADHVRYTATGDAGDTVTQFGTANDFMMFGVGFNTGGGANLDDVTNDDNFTFVTDAAVNFNTTDEALLMTTGVTSGSGAVNVAADATAAGVTASAGENGLIVSNFGANTEVYYYAEATGDGVVQNTELTLLATFNAATLTTTNFDFY